MQSFGGGGQFLPLRLPEVVHPQQRSTPITGWAFHTEGGGAKASAPLDLNTLCKWHPHIMCSWPICPVSFQAPSQLSTDTTPMAPIRHHAPAISLSSHPTAPQLHLLLTSQLSDLHQLPSLASTHSASAAPTPPRPVAIVMFSDHGDMV